MLLQVGAPELLFDDSARFAEKASQAGASVKLDSPAGYATRVLDVCALFVLGAGEALRSMGEFVHLAGDK